MHEIREALCVIDGMTLEPMLVANGSDAASCALDHAAGKITAFPGEAGKETDDAADSPQRETRGHTPTTIGNQALHEPGARPHCGQTQRGSCLFRQNGCRRPAIEIRLTSTAQTLRTRIGQRASITEVVVQATVRVHGVAPSGWLTEHPTLFITYLELVPPGCGVARGSVTAGTRNKSRTVCDRSHSTLRQIVES